MVGRKIIISVNYKVTWIFVKHLRQYKVLCMSGRFNIVLWIFMKALYIFIEELK